MEKTMLTGREFQILRLTLLHTYDFRYVNRFLVCFEEALDTL